MTGLGGLAGLAREASALETQVQQDLRASADIIK